MDFLFSKFNCLCKNFFSNYMKKQNLEGAEEYVECPKDCLPLRSKSNERWGLQMSGFVSFQIEKKRTLCCRGSAVST